MEGIIRKAKRTLTEEEVEGKIRLTGLTLQSSILLSSLPPFLSSFTTSLGAIGEAVFTVLHVVDNHAQMCLLTLLQNTYHSCRPVFTLQTFHAPTTKEKKSHYGRYLYTTFVCQKMSIRKHQQY